jgi:ribosomal protein S18 acetylase RimI-like enzyme
MTCIEPLRPGDWIAVLQHALARVPEAQRDARVRHCLQLLETGVLDSRGVWIARRGGEIVGVQICAPLAGSACLFWLPAADDDCTDSLVQAGLDWARSIGCKLAQALAYPDELHFTEPLVRCGFRPITRMHQLGHDLEDVAEEILAPLRYQSYRPSLHALFAATLERTYEGTLDCPELNGKRSIDEILAGHRGQGTFHPEFWWLAYDGAAPVGVVMLVEAPGDTSWELAYLGIVPESRGRRLGRALSLHALQALRAQPATRLLLAVDERNVPALRLYRSLGFVEFECNDVLLYFF